MSREQHDWNMRLLAASAQELESSMPDETKSQLRGVRFSAELDRAVVAKAKEMGMSPSQFLRFAAERLLDVKICTRCKGTGIVKGGK